MFTNPASVARLPIATGNLTLQKNSKISAITVTADGANGAILKVYAAADASDATTQIAQVEVLAAEKHKHVTWRPAIGKRDSVLYCVLTGANSAAYIAWE